jgi:hypothetical protein
VVGAPVVEATRPGSISIGIGRVRRRGFSQIYFLRVMDIRVMPQWDYGVPALYEGRLRGPCNFGDLQQDARCVWVVVLGV